MRLGEESKSPVPVSIGVGGNGGGGRNGSSSEHSLDPENWWLEHDDNNNNDDNDDSNRFLLFYGCDSGIGCDEVCVCTSLSLGRLLGAQSSGTWLNRSGRYRYHRGIIVVSYHSLARTLLSQSVKSRAGSPACFVR